MSAKNPCPCGCEQATAETVRQRLVECQSCGYSVRTTRKQLAAGVPLCGRCYDERTVIERMVPRCLYDRAAAGDEQAEKEVRHLGIVAYGRARGVKGSRPQRHRTQTRCGTVGCGRFMPDGATTCGSCGFDATRGFVETMPF